MFGSSFDVKQLVFGELRLRPLPLFAAFYYVLPKPDELRRFGWGACPDSPSGTAYPPLWAAQESKVARRCPERHGPLAHLRSVRLARPRFPTRRHRSVLRDRLRASGEHTCFMT